MKQRDVPGELDGIGNIHGIDKFNENFEILFNLFRNLLPIEIYTQIRKAIGEISHKKVCKKNERKCYGFYIIIKNMSFKFISLEDRAQDIV